MAADPAHAVARGALLGARGNSGVILSQLLRGAVDALVGTRAGTDPAEALRTRAASMRPRPGYAAVAQPVEGTILTVARAAAEAAAAAGRGGLAERGQGRRPTAPTRRWPAPRAARGAPAAGVVDAGGRGARRRCWTRSSRP